VADLTSSTLDIKLQNARSGSAFEWPETMCCTTDESTVPAPFKRLHHACRVVILLALGIAYAIQTAGAILAIRSGVTATVVSAPPQIAELTAADGAPFTDLGFSVAMSGDTAVATGSSASGIYVFVKPSSGWATTSAYTAKLTASDGAQFTDVAISGGTVVAIATSGLGYVFVQPVGGWANATQIAKLRASDGAKLFSVSIDSDTIVAGSPTSNAAQVQTGAAYVFVKPAGGWGSMSQTAKLRASDGVTDDRFGFSVAISGDTVMVGAPSAAVGTHPLQGAAYIFIKPTTGWATMRQNAKLTVSNAAPGENFGSAVAITANGALVGASQQYAVQGSHTGHGAAYIFARLSTGWQTTTKFTAKLSTSDGAKNDAFGYAVAFDDNTALIGAFNAAVGTNHSQGAVYSYVRPTSGWQSRTIASSKLIAADGVAGDSFGYSVALSNGTPLIGSPYHTLGSNTAQGAISVF